MIIRAVTIGITFSSVLYLSSAQAATAVVHKPTTYHNTHYHYVRPAVPPTPVVASPYYRPGYQCKTVCTPNANNQGVHCTKRCG